MVTVKSIPGLPESADFIFILFRISGPTQCDIVDIGNKSIAQAGITPYSYVGNKGDSVPLACEDDASFAKKHCYETKSPDIPISILTCVL